MAKVSSTAARPASRRSQDAPQDAPAATAPARATRSMRSQSREPSEQLVPQQPDNKGKGGASKRGGGRNKKKRQDNANNVTDLPIVEEDAEEALAPAATANEEEQLGDDVLAERRMSVGAMSGTTAKTSFSQEEMDGLDPDVMVDVLPSLANASKDLAELLFPDDPKSRSIVRKEIRKPDTKYNKLYHNRCDAIGIHRKAFGSFNFIQPSIVLRALMAVQHVRDVPEGDWRPDNIFYLINLAQMLRIIFITLRDNADISWVGFDEISNLDVNFASGIAGHTFANNSFEMCLELLTQLAIVRMTIYQSDPAFSPIKTIVETFYMNDDEGSNVFKHASVLHMQELDGEQSQAYTRTIQLRVDQLTDLFNEADQKSWQQSLDMARLQFTWDDFLERTTQYYLDRSQAIEAEISAAGGMQHILAELSNEVDRRADARKAEEKRQSYSRQGSTPKKAFGPGAMRQLKALAKKPKANAPVPPATAPVAVMVQPGLDAMGQQTAAPAVDDGFVHNEDDAPPLPSEHSAYTGTSNLAALSGIQNMMRQNAARAKGKGRSFLDDQPGAHRVSFDDSQSQTMEYQVPSYQDQASHSGPYYQSPPAQPGKRSHDQVDNEQEEFEPTQDEGFQTGALDTEQADRRRRALPPARTPQPRFSSIGSGVPGPSRSQQNSPYKRARKNPGSSIPPALTPFDPDADQNQPTGSIMDQARRNARNYTVFAANRRPAQVRNPWTSEEEDALIEYIREHGGDGTIPYATIKTIDAELNESKLARRSAEDLRFKARNMKECMLKGHMPLPENFERIVLDKKAIVKLHSLGIPYEQDAIRARTLPTE